MSDVLKVKWSSSVSSVVVDIFVTFSSSRSTECSNNDPTSRIWLWSSCCVFYAGILLSHAALYVFTTLHVLLWLECMAMPSLMSFTNGGDMLKKLVQISGTRKETYARKHDLHMHKPSCRRSKNGFGTKQSPWSFTTRYLTSWKSAASVSLYHSRPVAFWSLLAFKQLQARITSGISDVCPECGVAPHSVEHLFNCQSHPTQLTVQDLWDNPVAVADFLNLDNWR